MDEIIYVILKVLFDFALEVWFSIFSLDFASLMVRENKPSPKFKNLPYIRGVIRKFPEKVAISTSFDQ